MSNSVFDKAMEKVKNSVDIELVNNKDRYKKPVAKPNYNRTTIFDENLVAVHMKKTKIKYDKPVYSGMCILDISKTRVFSAYYNYFKAKNGKKVKLC